MHIQKGRTGLHYAYDLSELPGTLIAGLSDDEVRVRFEYARRNLRGDDGYVEGHRLTLISEYGIECSIFVPREDWMNGEQKQEMIQLVMLMHAPVEGSA